MDMSNYKFRNAKARAGDPDLFKNTPPSKADFDREVGKVGKLSVVFLLVGLVLMVPFTQWLMGDRNEAPLWLIIMAQVVFTMIWSGVYGFGVLFGLSLWYTCKSKGNTENFDRVAKMITEGERKDQILAYIQHENFMNREATLSEVLAIKKIAETENRLRTRKEAEQSLKSA